jgi:hypothetical protein
MGAATAFVVDEAVVIVRAPRRHEAAARGVREDIVTGGLKLVAGLGDVERRAAEQRLQLLSYPERQSSFVSTPAWKW